MLGVRLAYLVRQTCLVLASCEAVLGLLYIIIADLDAAESALQRNSGKEQKLARSRWKLGENMAIKKYWRWRSCLPVKAVWPCQDIELESHDSNHIRPHTPNAPREDVWHRRMKRIVSQSGLILANRYIEHATDLSKNLSHS